MINKYAAMLDFINTCPLVGYDSYFNVVDETTNDGNTSLMTVPYGRVVKNYVDGEKLMAMDFEIRQIKPLSLCSNTTANTETMQHVQDFLSWINTQGKMGNYPVWEGCEIISMSTPSEVQTPSVAGISENGALYAFPFTITYLERQR